MTMTQAQYPNMVERWSVVEIVLDGPAEGNPFVGLERSANPACKGRTIRQPEFCDGGGRYVKYNDTLVTSFERNSFCHRGLCAVLP